MANLKKILLVDDDDDLRDALAEQLVMTEDFDVFEADSGATGMARAQSQGHDMSQMKEPAAPPEAPPVSRPRAGKVRTLNGWTLPYRMNGGVKEFHLVAEEFEHEFAPGSKAICWGYNGSTPGPTASS